MLRHDQDPASNPLRRRLTPELFGVSGAGYCAENLYACCRPFFSFAKVIGMIPFDAGLSDFGEDINSGGMAASVVGITIITLLGCDAMVGLQSLARTKFTNAAEYSGAPVMFFFYFTGTYIIWYFHRHAQEMLTLFQRWNQMRFAIPLVDKTLQRDINFILGGMMGSTVLENLIKDSRFLQSTDTIMKGFGYNSTGQTYLQTYYALGCEQWAELVPYSAAISIYIFLSDKVTWYASNLADVLMVVFSRALYVKFKALFYEGERLTAKKKLPSSQYPTPRDGKEVWQQIAQDHYTLWCMIGEINNFLSPLLFLSIAFNTYTICIKFQLLMSDNSTATLLDNVWTAWTIAHMLLRVSAVCIAGSRLNDWAHAVTDLLRTCPPSQRSIDVIRAERHGTWNHIGWNGMNCFYVTNNLLMKIIGVFMTFEIIILQATEETNPGPTSNATMTRAELL